MRTGLMRAGLRPRRSSPSTRGCSGWERISLSCRREAWSLWHREASLSLKGASSKAAEWFVKGTVPRATGPVVSSAAVSGEFCVPRSWLCPQPLGQGQLPEHPGHMDVHTAHFPPPKRHLRFASVQRDREKLGDSPQTQSTVCS